MLKVYNGEYFERSQWRYLGYGMGVLTLVVFSFWYENIWGALLLLLISGGYFYLQTRIALGTTLKVESSWIQVGKRMLPYPQIEGFVVEIDQKTGHYYGIVFLMLAGQKESFSFRDDDEQIEAFIWALQPILPQLNTYSQSGIEKLMRKLKI